MKPLKPVNPHSPPPTAELLQQFRDAAEKAKKIRQNAHHVHENAHELHETLKAVEDRHHDDLVQAENMRAKMLTRRKRN